MLILLSIAALAVKAQNRGVVKAVILDSVSRQPIQFVTVSIINPQDSSLIAYTITDKSGAFTLRGLKDDAARLIISHVGYQGLRINLKFKPGEGLDLGKLYLSAKLLQEVLVRGERVPVTMRKDTLEFDAEAFKTRPTALVEDLLRKLPGVQVDHDGHITVNGKDISRIKVNGKDFFLNDPKIATRNLEAGMVSKVQVYDDRENDPDHLIPDDEVKKIINLKFKKAFTDGLMGNFETDAGTNDRYKVKAFLSRFFGKGNFGSNTNNNNLSNTDVFDSDSRTDPMSAGSANLVKTNSASLTFSEEFSKKFKITSSNYSFNLSGSDNRTTTQKQQFIGDTIFKNNAINKDHSTSGSQNLGINAEWNPDTTTRIQFAPSINYYYNSQNSYGQNISSSNFVPLLNTNTTSGYNNGNSLNYRQSISIYHKLHKKNASVSASNEIYFGPNNSRSFSNSELLSYVTALPSDTLNRTSKTSYRSSGGTLSGNIHYPFNKKLSADITLEVRLARNDNDVVTYQQDLKTGLYNIFLLDQSNSLIRTDRKETATPTLTYSFTDKIYVRTGFMAQVQQTANHFNSYTDDINQHFFYVLPSFEFHANRLWLSYSTQVRQPSISDLRPGTIVYSPLYSFTGNPNLKATHTQTLSLNYFSFSKSQLAVSVFSRISFDSNSILRERTVNAEGAEVAMPVNREGRTYASINGNIRKSFKKRGKWLISESTGIYESYGHNFFEVNRQSGYQNTNDINLRQELAVSYNSMLDIISAYRVDHAVTKYQQIALAENAYTTHAASLAVYLRLPERYMWDVSYVYRYSPLVATGFQRSSNLLSVSIAKKIQKSDRGEFRVTCYDLLNEGVSSYHYASENFINDGQYQILKRYFLFSYFYRFNDFGKKQIRR